MNEAEFTQIKAKNQNRQTSMTDTEIKTIIQQELPTLLAQGFKFL
ncbi:MAG: hypothetical protein WCP16_17790 [Pseudanabaena sp. ELA645]